MKKKVISVILSLTILATLTGCGAKDAEKSKEAMSSDKITIVLDWTPNTNHTGLYVAKEKGYFDEAGLSVEIVEPPEGSTTQLIASGGAQFGISFQDTLAKAFASDTPLPVTAVAAILQHNTSGVISLKEQGIETPKDLSGHTYATWEDPIELAILKQIVTEDGGDFDTIELIPNTVTNIIAALQTDVDSVWVYRAWDGMALDVAGMESNFINFADYGTELDYYSPVLIANNDYLNDHGDEAKKVIAAIEQGYEYSIDNPKEAADILLKYAPENEEDLVYASQEWISKQYKADATQWGYIDPTRWDGFYRWLSDNQLIDQEIPAGFGFSNDYLGE